MIVIPAIDLKNGKCVRLFQGEMDQVTVYSDHPAETAMKWEAEGAQRIHVVDLDGAVAKTPQNLGVIKEILKAVHIPVQIGGGIRNEDTIQMYVDSGIDKIIIGTEAVKNPELVKKACRLFPGRIIIGIDARKGLVAVEGWTETTAVSAIDLARQFEDHGVFAINFTDIHRDGAQTGPNIEETARLAKAVSIPVVASGGVSSIADIKNLLPLEAFGVIGVITGKALYAGTVNLKEAIAVANN